MSQEELMLEVELIRNLDSYFRKSKLTHRYELRLSSSELLDALFEECNVDLADRLHLLQLLYELGKQRGTQDNNSRQSLNEFGKKGVNINKLQEIMKIKGSATKVAKQLLDTKHIQCKARFDQIVNYFRRIEETLSLFEIYTEPDLEQEKPFETKKEQAS